MEQKQLPAQAVGRVKRAELMSSLGAGLIGFGLGAMLASFIADLALFVVIAGVLMHGWGMYDKHAAERDQGRSERAWMKLLYWSCWFILAALLAVLIVRFLR